VWRTRRGISLCSEVSSRYSRTGQCDSIQFTSGGPSTDALESLAARVNVVRKMHFGVAIVPLGLVFECSFAPSVAITLHE
jgi:hypothetical protein